MLASLLCNTPRAVDVGRWYVLPDGHRTRDKGEALAVLNAIREEAWDTGDVEVPREAAPRKKKLVFPAQAGESAPMGLDEDEDALIAVLVALSSR